MKCTIETLQRISNLFIFAKKYSQRIRFSFSFNLKISLNLCTNRVNNLNCNTLRMMKDPRNLYIIKISNNNYSNMLFFSISNNKIYGCNCSPFECVANRTPSTYPVTALYPLLQQIRKTQKF